MAPLLPPAPQGEAPLPGRSAAHPPWPCASSRLLGSTASGQGGLHRGAQDRPTGVSEGWHPLRVLLGRPRARLQLRWPPPSSPVRPPPSPRPAASCSVPRSSWTPGLRSCCCNNRRASAPPLQAEVGASSRPCLRMPGCCPCQYSSGGTLPPGSGGSPRDARTYVAAQARHHHSLGPQTGGGDSGSSYHST